MREEEIEKSLLDPEISVIIIHGPSDSGKTFTVKNILKNFNHVYINENDYTIDRILERFDLKNEYLKYLEMLKTMSPGEVGEIEAFLTMVKKRIEKISTANVVIVLDRACNMPDNFLPLLPEFIEKFIESGKAKLVIIYHDDCNNEKFFFTIKTLNIKGTKEIVFPRPNFREMVDTVLQMDYFVPDEILKIIYSKTMGKIGKTIELLNLLESKRYIINGFYVGDLSSRTLDEISTIIFSEKKPLEYLDEEERKILLFVSFSEKGVDAFDLPSIIQMDENELINKLDKLIRLKFLQEDGNRVIVGDKDISYETMKNFSNVYLSMARSRMADYFRSKGNLYESGKLYFQAGKYDQAFPLLLETGMNFYREGKFSEAAEILEYAIKIKYDDEAVKALLNILTLQENYKKVIEITEPLIMKYPEKISLRLRYAEALYNTGKYREAEIILRDLLNTAKEKEDLLYDYINLGRILIAREKFREADEILENALKIAREIQDRRKEALVLRLKGNIHYSMDENDIALDLYKKSLGLVENTQYYEDIASLYNNIANILVERDLQNGMEYYNRALKIARENWYVSLLETIYHNLSLLKIYRGEINSALDMQRKALNIAVSRGNYGLAFLSITNMMDSMVKKGEFKEEMHYVEMAIEFALNLGDEFMENFFRAYKKVLERLMGKEVELGEEINYLRQGTPMFRDLVEYIISAMEMWSGNMIKANEIQKRSIERKMEKITPEILIDMCDLAEFLLYEHFFHGKREKDIEGLIETVEKNVNFSRMEYVQWRIGIVKNILHMDEKSEKNFLEYLSNFEREGLKYLIAKMKTIFGLYFAKKMGNRKYLDEGLSLLKEFNLPGINKAYSEAFSFQL